MDLYQEYGLRRVINAYDKATALGGARVLPEIARVVSAGLPLTLETDALQEAAGRAIAEATGAEWGCATACAAAGITLGVAACMTGADPEKVARLPDTTGMVGRVLIQKGHCISFGAPVAQMVRLSGADLVEVGKPNGCQLQQMAEALSEETAAAVVAVESYHTADYQGIGVRDLVALAHEAGVPVVMDAATQELRLCELVSTGADLVVCSAHKYLGSTTAGVVAGRRDLVEAVLLQNRGIGRPMKVGKEGILGVMAAFGTDVWRNPDRWSVAEGSKIDRIVERLAGIAGLAVQVSPDPNGCPFVRARLTIDPGATGHTAASLRQALAAEEPAVVVRIYGSDPERVYLNATEMTVEEVDIVCDRVRALVDGSH